MMSSHPRTAYAFMALVFLFCFAITVSAKQDDSDLGVIGPVYRIKEEDFLEYIKDRLLTLKKSGELAKIQQKELAQAKRTIHRPKPTPGITRTTKARVFYVDPSVRIDHTIKDQKGRVIVMAGTQVNPFDYISMTTDLIFFNGDDPKQVQWAKKMDTHYHGRIMPIMVRGSPIDLMKAWKRRVYFDQQGTLTKHFHIKHVPAIVSQYKKLLRIAEIVL